MAAVITVTLHNDMQGTAFYFSSPLSSSLPTVFTQFPFPGSCNNVIKPLFLFLTVLFLFQRYDLL